MNIYQRIFENTPDPLLVIDRDGRIIIANARCEMALGYPPQELLGQQVEMLVPARFAGAHAQHRSQYAADPQTRRMGRMRRDLCVRCKDGSELPVDIMISPLPGDGELVFLCALRDVSARLAAEQQLIRHAAELEVLHEQLKVLASHDSLTGLFNRRTFEEQAEWMLRNAIRRHTCLSLLMIDLDFFKRVNDVHGHPEGDRVLEGVGAALRGTCRQSDLAARYGGEEFVVALPDTDERGSMVAAENFRLAVNNIPGLRTPLTASIGAVTFRSNGETPPVPQILRALISRVDVALYAAKKAGRNCVRHANGAQQREEPPGPPG